MKYTEEKLKVILEEHKLWLKSEGAQGKRANLAGADLTTANLEGANLTEANLAGAKLKGADLTNADLQYDNQVLTLSMLN